MDPKAKRLARLATFALGGILAHGLARFLFKAWRYLESPYSRDYGEGCVLAMVQLLHEKGTYFTDLAGYPFVHGNYPPVFILLVWPFHALLGPSLLAPRLLSLLATLGLLAALFVLTRRLAGEAAIAGALTALALCPWFVQSWAPMGRVDMLALFFSLAGLAIAVGGRPPGKALALFALAFFTKQNALLAPAALLLYQALEGPPSRAVRAAAAFVIPLAALFGGLAWITGGEAYRHLVPYTAAAEYEWGRMGSSYVELAAGAWPLLVLILWTLVRAPRALTEGPPRLLFIYWVLNLLGFATIAKAGAAQNYFIEPWIATVALAAAAVRTWRDTWPRGLAHAALAAAAGVALYSSPQGHRLPPSIRYPERAHDFQDLWETVRATSGPILSENLSVLVVNRKPVLVEPFGMLLLAQKGLFDPGRLVRDCEAGVFPLIVAEHRLEKIPGFGECLETRYEAWKDLSTYRLFRPKRGGPANGSAP